jgi:hypothetical protein
LLAGDAGLDRDRLTGLIHGLAGDDLALLLRHHLAGLSGNAGLLLELLVVIGRRRRLVGREMLHRHARGIVGIGGKGLIRIARLAAVATGLGHARCGRRTIAGAALEGDGSLSVLHALGLRVQERAFGDKTGCVFLLLVERAALLVHDGIGKGAVLEVDESPLVLAGERVFVTAPEIADVLESLEFFDGLGVLLVLANEDLDGALVLLAAGNEEGFFFPLGLEQDARGLEVEHHGGGGAEGEDEKQCGEAASCFPVAGRIAGDLAGRLGTG